MNNALIVLAFSLVVVSLGAQDAPPARAGDLRIDVVAVDERGAPVTDLRPSEFEVWISGYRVPISDVYVLSPGSGGTTMILLLDNGAIGPTLAPRVKEAARHLVTQMAAGDRLAVVPLHGRSMEITDDRARLLSAIDEFHVRGFPFRPEDAGQHVLRTLEALALRIPETSEGRKPVVAIGAGWLFDTPLPPPGAARDLQPDWVAAMRAMAGAHASLYVIDPVGLDSRRGLGAHGGSGGFARETGGYAFLATNDLAGAAERIWAETRASYMLAVPNPPVQRNADLREVEIKVLRKGVTVRARRGIKGRA
jgi:VWFA-related protein